MNTITYTAVAEALAKLPEQQQSLLAAYAATQPLNYLPADWVDDLKGQQSLASLGLSLLPLAASFAVAPVSNFHVGAVAFDSDGNAYLGANFEFADSHIAQTLHAEQSAIANAWACGAKDLALLVINYPPCGHCRQFINEVNVTDDFHIQLPSHDPQPLAYYLPDAFGPADLGIDERLLGNKHPNHHGDLLVQAKAACAASHAPYSHSHSGIALQYADGDIVTGRYAENAAFNPSLPALQMALNSRRLQGKNWRDIEKAVMIETTATLSQKKNTQHLLDTITITPCIFEYRLQ